MHWAKARIEVTNACEGSEVDEIPLYVNPEVGPLDLGEAAQAPLQANETDLAVKLWADE